MELFALTRFSAYALYLMGAIYVFLAAYVLLGGWRQITDRRVQLKWFLLVPAPLFVTLWFAGRWIWALFYWIFIFGDAGPYEEYASFTSSFIALVIVVTICVRQAFGLCNRWFRQITFGCTVAIASLLLAIQAYDFASRICGWTAEGAATNYLAKFRGERHPFVSPGAQRRIVEVSAARPDEEAKEFGQSRRFALYYGEAPLQDVRVSPYGWFWWTFASSQPVTPTFEMDSAVANWDADPEKSSQQLTAVIKNYPNSEASRWAAKTLESLNKNGKQGVTPWQAVMMQKLREELKRRRQGESGIR